MRQLAKKLESSKSTAKYIKQVSNEPQATQVNLLRHQHTDLPPNKYQRKQRKFKPRSNNHKYQQEERKADILAQESEKFRKNTTIKKKDVTSVVIHPTLNVSDIHGADISASIAVK